MGGASIFRLKKDDPNVGVIIETLTEHGHRFCMAQNFLPEIVECERVLHLGAGKDRSSPYNEFPSHDVELLIAWQSWYSIYILELTKVLIPYPYRLKKCAY